jgi:hypothetical protein
MKNIKIAIKPLIAVVLLLASSCQLTNLDINKDPNNPLEVPPQLLLTNAELSAFSGPLTTLSNTGLGFTGIIATNDRFDLNFTSFEGTWNGFYSNALKDVDEILKATDPAKVNNPHYRAIAQILKAYYFSVVVDYWGEAPYSEAFKGNDASFLVNPKYDEGKPIYDELFKLLDEAVANLNRPTPVTVQGDAIFNGNAAAWIRTANSLRLRLLIQTRRVDTGAASKVAAAINAAGGLIGTPAQDFSFRFSSLVNPDNRHPWFSNAYAAGSNGFTYIIHQYVLEMLENEDPRTPFYFKRQTRYVLDLTDPTDLGTVSTGYPPYNPEWVRRLYTNKGRTFNPAVDRPILAGYMGRERGDPAGVPQDTDLRLAPGVYPAGGFYDDPARVALTGGNNIAGGAGIFPAITSVNVKFYQIEAMLALGVPGNPRTLFEQTIREHIGRVVSLSGALDTRSIAPTTAAVDAYVKLFMDRYDAAPSNDAKLNVVLKQAWFCNWGNGIETYNAFRRTGYPSDIRTPLNRVRQFALRIPFAQDDLNLNTSAPKTPPAFDATPVFWDVLKFRFQ